MIVFTAVLAGCIAMIAIGLLTPRRLAARIRRLDADAPRRWRRPTRPVDDEDDATLPAAITQGRCAAADPDAAPLRAPFSGTECLAWQVAVLFDLEGDAEPPRWALHETAAVDLRIGDAVVPASRVAFADDGDPVEADTASDGTELRTFLRKRGLFASDGEYLCFEQVILPGAELSTTVQDELCHLRPAAGSAGVRT